MLKRISQIIDNLTWYCKIILNDKDDDYIFILLMLRQKLLKVQKHWGNHTEYEHDYDDKFKLQELIQELDIFIDRTFELTESQNKKELEKIFSKLGRFLPRLWN